MQYMNFILKTFKYCHTKKGPINRRKVLKIVLKIPNIHAPEVQYYKFDK